ncbi:hypothetical protein [Thiothrix eikelboomii]|uniref:hypothetical protein n=1 Tax=Thiothrix eikelboomii TaxID=92487 RepID=UPI003BB1D655
MKGIVFLVSSVFLMSSVSAGMTALTHTSRANCINNESVSWQYNVPKTMFVSSKHKFNINGSLHTISSGGYVTNWRVAGIHWSEGGPVAPIPPVWTVYGTHLIKVGTRITQISSYATNCSVFDGWW